MNKVIITSIQAQSLSKRQKQFNSLVEIIEKLKFEKQTIAQNILTVKEIYHKQILPLVQKNLETTIQLIFTFDRALENYSIPRRYQNAIVEFIKSTIIQIMPTATLLYNDKIDSIKALFEKHDNQSYDEYLLQIRQHKEELMQSDQLHYQEEIEEKTQSQRNTNGAKQTQKAQKQKVAGIKVKKDMKAIYTNLAKQLHPDLEQDERLIPQKNELMKAVTQAYTNNDLYELLRIQMEVETLNIAALANTPDTIMDSYIKMLKTQKVQLSAEITSMIEETPMYANFVDNVGQIATPNVNRAIKSLKKKSTFLGELIVQAKSEKTFNQLAEVFYKEQP